MRALVSLAVGLSALLSLSLARADSACCHGWLGADYATCKIYSGACVGGDTRIEVDYVGDGGSPTCAVGSTTCAVTAEWTCCLQDCSGAEACTSNRSYPPTCCVGMCLETISPGATSVDLNSVCTNVRPMQPLAACCYQDRIEVPAAAATGPGEWQVGTGDPVVADAGPEASPQPIAAPELEVHDESDAAAPPAASNPGDQIGGCFVSPSPARDSVAWLALFGLWALVQLRRR